MENKFIIRRAQTEDLEDILRLNLELFKKEYHDFDPALNLEWTYGIGKNNFIDCIGNDNRFAAVSRIQGKTIGYLCGSFYKVSWKNGWDAEIDNMFIEEKFRNLGIGHKLIKDFIEWSRSQKADRVIVRASAHNRRGVDFYKQNGFQDYDVVLQNILSSNLKPMATKKAKEETKREEFKVSGEKILEKVKELIKEGNVRRIIIISDKGETMMEIPLTFAVVGTALAPVLAAVGALAALIANCTIVVERK